MITSQDALLLSLMAGLLVADSVNADSEPRLAVTREGEEILATLRAPLGAGEIEWVIESGRNARIERMGERSFRSPDTFPDRPFSEDRAIWFPIVDIELFSGFEAEAVFNNVGEGDELCFNGNFLNHSVQLEESNRLRQGVEHWENQVFVKSKTARFERFSFVKQATVGSPDGRAQIRIRPLSSDWRGSIGVRGKDVSGEWVQLAMEEVTSEDSPEESVETADEITSEKVIECLRSTVRYLLASQNRNPASPTFGGLNLFYDSDAGTFRRSDWIWSYGPAIKFLLDASEVEAVSETVGYETLRIAARDVVEASLRFRIDEIGHPAEGLVLCRLDPRLDSPRGAEGFSSPADSLFLAGWGWMPYYKATGDRRFLEGARSMAQAVDRILERDDLVEQDYLLREGKWKNWTMDESGFGMVGFEELYTVDGDESARNIGKRYLEGLLRYLERDDGLWDRTWHRNDPSRSDNGWPVKAQRGSPVLIETKFSTRGLGWAMIGLLSAHRMMPDDGSYLEKAIALSDHLLRSQSKDGYWDFLFRDPQYPDEISAKGTALWSLLFYQLYAETGEPRHLEAARRALLWCANNRVANGLGSGGIPEVNRESGVVYRRWSRLTCSYAMSWFGLALLEELKLGGR